MNRTGGGEGMGLWTIKSLSLSKYAMNVEDSSNKYSAFSEKTEKKEKNLKKNSFIVPSTLQVHIILFRLGFLKFSDN
jgi:hypothetical protein